MKETSYPIGIFDSGIGGLTVANAISKLLPHEQLIYFGDTAHFPYGEKSPSALRDYCLRISDFLRDCGCKIIIVACNSAWSSAYALLNKEFDSIVNVVDPVVNLIKDKDYNRIGLIATRATVRNGIFSRKIKRHLPKLEVVSRSTPLLVHIIEEGLINDPIGQAVISKHFDNHTFGEIDALVLACTHFPIIKEFIKPYFNQNVDIIDSNDLVANEVYNLLKKRNQLSAERKGKNEFYFSDLTEVIYKSSRTVYKGEIQPTLKNIWA